MAKRGGAGKTGTFRAHQALVNPRHFLTAMLLCQMAREAGFLARAELCAEQHAGFFASLWEQQDLPILADPAFPVWASLARASAGGRTWCCLAQATRSSSEKQQQLPQHCSALVHPHPRDWQINGWPDCTANGQTGNPVAART
jgi:hypothetical protein